VTAEDVGAYKPDPAHFRAFRDSFGVERGSWVHVAESHYHDVVPAHALGVAVVWINRLGQDRDASLATAVLPDLTALPATLTGIFDSIGSS
jgi:2-haloacid dehalogenase